MNYCFYVTADLVANYVGSDAQSSCNLGYFDNTETKTYWCGTSQSSCSSDRQNYLNSNPYYTCTDVAAASPFWNQQVGSNGQGFPTDGCIGTYYSYGQTTDVGPVTNCNNLPPQDSYCN